MALEPVIIQFTTAGVSQVEAAFRTVEQTVVRMERNSTQVSERSARTRVKTAEQEAKERARADAKLQKDKERLEKQHSREVERESKRRDAIVRRSSEMAGRYAQQEANAEARRQAEQTRTVEREAERRMRLQIRSSEMAGRFAAKQAAEDLRRQEASASVWGQRGRRVGGIVTNSAGRTLSGMASLVGAGLGIGGGMMLADAARGEMSAHRSAQLIVNAVTTGGNAPPGATVDAILGKASQVGRANGLSKDEVAQAGLAYARSATGGDFAGVMGNMDFFAKVHNVTGADMAELASSAGMLQSQNPKLGGANNGAMQQLLLDVIQQTHMGSLSMPEVAKMAGVIGSGRGSFAGDQGQNQRKLLALAQLVAPETNPEEAGVMVKDFATEGQKHFDKLGALGVKFNKRGQMESIEQAIDAVLTGSRGNQGTILKAFGSDRGAKLFAHLAPIYNDAGGGKAGLEKVHEAVSAVTGATMSSADLDKRNAETLADPANKIKLVFNQISDEIGNALEPRLKHFADDTLPKLIPRFEAVIDAAASFAAWFADNPIKGVGAVVLTAIAKDLANAGIAAAAEAGVAVIMKKIAAMIGGGGGIPTPTPTGGSGTLAKLGAAAAGLTIGVDVGEAVAPLIFDPIFDAKAKSQNEALSATFAGSNMASQLRAKARAGKVTAADISAAQKMASALGSQQQTQQLEAANQRAAADTPILGALSEPAAAASAGALKNTTQSLEALNEAIALAASQLTKLGATASNTNPGASNRNVPLGSGAR